MPRDDSLHDGSRTYIRPHGLPDPAWEWHEAAYRVIRDQHAKIDRDRDRRGQPFLLDENMTSEQRANAIRFILSGEQDTGTVAAAAAQCVAFLGALLRAEDQAPHLGDAA